MLARPIVRLPTNPERIDPPMSRQSREKIVHELPERETPYEQLVEEVKRLRRDCDILGMQRTIDRLLQRVSVLESRVDRLSN